MDEKEIIKKIIKDFDDIEYLHSELISTMKKSLLIDNEIFKLNILNSVKEKNNYLKKELITMNMMKK